MASSLSDALAPYVRADGSLDPKWSEDLDRAGACWSSDVMASGVRPPAVFEVRAPGGHVYRFWADGRVEGFPAGSWVLNRVPSIIASAEGRA